MTAGRLVPRLLLWQLLSACLCLQVCGYIDTTLPDVCRDLNDPCPANSECNSGLCRCEFSFHVGDDGTTCTGYNTFEIYLNLNIKTTLKQMDGVDQERVDLNASLATQMDAIVFHLLADRQYLATGYEVVGDYTAADGESFYRYDILLAFAEQIDEDITFVVYSVLAASHVSALDYFGTFDVGFRDAIAVSVSQDYKEPDWCPVYSRMGYPICGLDVCHDTDVFIECTTRVCDINYGLDLKTMACVPCAIYASSSADELFCFYGREEPSILSDVTISIEGAVNNCAFFDGQTAQDYVNSMNGFLRSLFIKNSLCDIDGQCSNLYMDVDEMNGTVTCVPAYSCKDRQYCYEYRYNMTIHANGVPDKIQEQTVFDKKRFVVDAIIEALYLWIPLSDIRDLPLMALYHCHFILPSATYTLEKSGGPSTVQVIKTVDFEAILDYDISVYDLTNQEDYQQVYDLIYRPSLNKLRQKVSGIKAFIINSLSHGSVIIDATTYIDAHIETSLATNMVEALVLLSETGVVINGTTVAATVVVKGIPVTPSTDKCVILKLIEPCIYSYYCTLDSNGKAHCMEELNDVVPGEDMAFIVGLSVGVSILLFISILAIAVIYIRSKKTDTFETPVKKILY